MNKNEKIIAKEMKIAVVGKKAKRLFIDSIDTSIHIGNLFADEEYEKVIIDSLKNFSCELIEEHKLTKKRK